VFQNLASYQGVSTLKKAALNLLVRQAAIESDLPENE
jgi:calcium-dependent protein kinase